MKIKIYRYRYFLIYILCLLAAYVFYFQFRANKAVDNYTKATNEVNQAWQQVTSPSLTPEPENDVDSKSDVRQEETTLYQDDHLAFELSNSLRLVDKSHDFTSTHVKYFYIYSPNCNFPEIWYGVRTTGQAGTALAQENPQGPSDQVTRIEVINGMTVGVRIQPVGDGSGGYEPSVTIDFLSRSKKYHYYFSASAGCNDSATDTYTQDLIPILNSIRRLE